MSISISTSIVLPIFPLFLDMMSLYFSHSFVNFVDELVLLLVI